MANYAATAGLALFIGVLIGFLLSLRAQTRLGIRAAVKKHADEAFALIGYRAWVETNPLFNELVRNLSPSFCDIYTESSIVERERLLQVCGVGYGKALEFLIKDYAKTENPDHKAEIEQSPLANCIKQYIRDPAIRDSAELATWLRNDETHYLRKFEDKDVGHLKQLIKLTVALIEHAELKKSLVSNVKSARDGMVRQ